MFGQVLQTSVTLATGLAGSNLPGAAEKVRADARTFLDQAVPHLGQMRQGVISFSSAAAAQLNNLEQTLATGAPAASVAATLHQLGQSAVSLQSQVQKGNTGISRWRDSFAHDSATLTTERVQAKAKLDGLQAERDRFESEASNLRHRLQIINSIPIVSPIIKIADEIASLIQSSKFTEERLDDANRRLAELQSQAVQLNCIINQLSSLNVATGQLAGGTQSLVNVVNLVADDLQNYEKFAEAANANSALLFLKALQANINSLLQTAE
jgi:hypothetical protein